MPKTVFSFGGGLTSFFGAVRAIEQYGSDNVDVINAALEDDELYIKPVIDAFEQHTGKQIVRISISHTGLDFAKKLRLQAEQKTLSPTLARWMLDAFKKRGRATSEVIKTAGPIYGVWDVFFWRGMLGSSQRDPCSDQLKRQVLHRYIRDTYTADTLIAVGMTADEIDRHIATSKIWRERGYKVVSPLLDANYDHKKAMSEFETIAGFIPNSYAIGMDHNNCPACVKSGQENFARVLYFRPDVYTQWAHLERYHQRMFSHRNTILKRQINGETIRLPLDTLGAELREKWANTFVLPGMEELLFWGLEKTPSCRYCESAA